MIGMMIRTTLTVAVASYAVGVVHSSWKHYFAKYSDEEDRINPGLVTKVSVVEKKKSRARGGKK
jgi:hypothetical protein